MPKVKVINNDFDQALKEFKRMSNDIRRIKKRYDFYLRPGLKAREKSKNAAKKRRY